MAKKTKFFRVAVEGLTADRREITRAEIEQMAATYNREKYGARVFVEHIRGLLPDGPFRALGDVTAVKAEKISDGPLKGKLALYAQIEPSADMIKLVNSGQKIYSSVEIAPSLSDSKLAYLIGLGITDSPASLGTEVLAFAAQHPEASPFTARKHAPENLFSAAIESTIELEPEETAADPAAGFFAKLESLIEKFSLTPKAKPAPKSDADSIAIIPAEFAAELGETLKEFSAGVTKQFEAFRAELATSQQATDTALAEFRAALDTTPANARQRPPATGGNGAVVTDC